MTEFMINHLDAEISYKYGFSFDDNSYILLLNSIELRKLLGTQYEKYLGLNDNEKFRYKELFDKNEIDYIAQQLINGIWSNNGDFHVNVFKEEARNIICNEDKKTITLTANVEVALIEEYRLYCAIEWAYMLGKEVEGVFKVYLTNFNIDRLHKVLSQRIKEGSRKTKGI